MQEEQQVRRVEESVGSAPDSGRVHPGDGEGPGHTELRGKVQAGNARRWGTVSYDLCDFPGQQKMEITQKPSVMA